MSIVLEAIKLNHDPIAAHSDALNIRKNASEFVNVPEWQRGISTKPEDAPAAYALKDTSGKQLTIQAKFSRLEPGIHSFEVRAVDPANPRAQGCLYEILRRLGIIPFLPPPFGNCLGEVKPLSLTFPASGVTNFETFQLDPIWPLANFGVGVYPVTWQWQFRLHPGEPWKDLDKTYHRIYLILEVPKSPWQQNPYDSANTQIPWTAALDKACTWAAKARTREEAAVMITRAVNTQPLQSYTPATIFGFFTYYLSSYLQQLDSGTTFNLNCTDCADAVTTLANLLGCDLVEGRFFNMVTRKFLTLNGNPWIEADWVSWNWSYHEICWLGQMGPNEFIYDGCLQVDMDDNYSDTIHFPQHPIKMRFGMSDPQDYRYRLIESGSGQLENIPRRRPLA